MGDLASIDAAVEAYKKRLDEADRKRLAFFAAIWHEQQACGQDYADDLPDYALPSEAELNHCYRADSPVFASYPCPVNEEVLVGTLKRFSAVFCAEGDYPEPLKDGLDGISWENAAPESGLDIAGCDPAAWLEGLEELLEEEGSQPDVARMAALIASLALKVQLQKPAAAVMEALAGGAGEPRSTLCPVCGTSPMLAHVGGPTSSEGRGRVLVCGQCGAVWEFERIRCARCGTRHESALHHFHIEGDEQHRIATCDECGGYIRTLYSEGELLPVAYEVEDVVMARLDAVAARALATPDERI